MSNKRWNSLLWFLKLIIVKRGPGLNFKGAGETEVKNHHSLPKFIIINIITKYISFLRVKRAFR